MYRPGHVGAALLCYAPVAFLAAAVGGPPAALLGGVGAVTLAMLPDVDVRLPLVSHRGPTHTVWFALLVAVVLGAGGLAVGLASGPLVGAGLGLLGFAVGVTTIGSHVAADALTPMGVEPFAPLSSRSYSLGVARASNPVANYLLLCLGTALAGVAVAAGIWVDRLV